MKRDKVTLSFVFIVLIYWSITYVWDLLPFDMIDVTFMLLITCFVLALFHKPIKVNKAIQGEIACIIAIVLFAVVFFAYACFKINQSMFESFLTIREMLYISVALPFALLWKMKPEFIRLIVKLELIGCILYFITFIVRQPLSPIAHFTSSYVLVGSLKIYRDFCPVPCFPIFVCAYLTLGIINKQYLWNRQKDLYSIIIIVATIILHLSRTKLMFVLVDILFVSFISIEKNKRKRILKKIGPAFGVVIAAFVIVACIPTVRNRFAEGIEDISYTLSGNELDPYHGTFTYRMWLFSYRIQYLKEQHKLLFGLGPISSRNNTAYFGNGTLRSDMSIVYNPDNSYMTLLPRYGILGTLFYVGILIILAIRCYKNKTKLSVATAMHIICSLFQGMIGNAALCEYSLMVIGLLVGMCMAEKQLGIKSLE